MSTLGGTMYQHKDGELIVIMAGSSHYWVQYQCIAVDDPQIKGTVGSRRIVTSQGWRAHVLIPHYLCDIAADCGGRDGPDVTI